ncbi:MAG TPA: hypothetical protein K8W25_05685 [Aerococcus urinaeequi]|nr:hypothetical protein [Aerococcus urinaeequi]
MAEALANHYRFMFYHDPYYRVIEYTEDGKNIQYAMKSSRDVHIPFTHTPRQVDGMVAQ